MTLPPAISRAYTLELLRGFRTAVDAEEASDIEAQIVAGNLRFCMTTARQYQGHGVPLDDLFAEAVAALLTAVRSFDAHRNTAFSGYAARCLRQALIRAVRRQGSVVAIPRTEDAVGEATVHLDHQPESVSDAMISGDDDADPERDALAKIDADRLAELVSGLPEREAVIVRMRFGLSGLQPHELSEIGVVLGVTKQRVAALLDNALARLRSMLTPKPGMAA